MSIEIEELEEASYENSDSEEDNQE